MADIDSTDTVKSIEENQQEFLSKILILNEISAILYQVNDLETALDMILDTCTEYLKIARAGIIIEDKSSGYYKLIRHKNFEDGFAEHFQFKNNDVLNDSKISSTKPSHIEIPDGIIKLKSGNKIDVGNLSTLSIFPIVFHDKILGFLLTALVEARRGLSEDEKKLMSMLTVQIAPVLFTFDAVSKSEKGTENIISKIIRDRMYEAQMVLSPISFSIFRIIPYGNFEHSLPLEDAINTYRKIFSNCLDPLGDTIWLTPDTIFFIYPKADLFKTESLCANLKQEVENQFSGSESDFSFLLKYVCLSYPQSGKDTNEIISNLWFKLFEEMSELNTGKYSLEQNSFK